MALHTFVWVKTQSCKLDLKALFQTLEWMEAYRTVPQITAAPVQWTHRRPVWVGAGHVPEWHRGRNKYTVFPASLNTHTHRERNDYTNAFPPSPCPSLLGDRHWAVFQLREGTGGGLRLELLCRVALQEALSIQQVQIGRFSRLRTHLGFRFCFKKSDYSSSVLISDAEWRPKRSGGTEGGQLAKTEHFNKKRERKKAEGPKMSHTLKSTDLILPDIF